MGILISSMSMLGRLFAARAPVVSMARRMGTTAPQASDRWVNITFVNQNNGDRWPVVGLEGQTLLALAKANNIGLRGGTTRASHVMIPKEFEARVPVSDAMAIELEDGIEEAVLSSGSRLADQVVLTKEMTGMNVAVPLPEGPPEFP